MAVKYDMNANYRELIDEAVRNNDFVTAAKYEQQRNAKINDLNATGTNKYDAKTSTDYAKYLSDGYTGVGSHNDANIAPSDMVLLDQYKADWNTASSLGDQAAMDAAHKAAEQLRAKYNYSGGGDGSDYIKIPTAGMYTMPSFDASSFDDSKPSYTGDYSKNIDALLNELLTRDNFTFEDAPIYTDNYTGKIQNMMGQIENRDPFSYDAAADPLYQQFRTQYNREGDRAVNDTLAAVASGAGGMNSYAVTAAQQANDYYAAQLADKIPELQQLAYQMYMQDFNDQVTELNLLRGLGETEYNRWRDAVGDWRTNRSEAYGMYLDEIDQKVRDLGLMQDMDNTQYNRYRDTMSDWRNDRDFAYGSYRDSVGDYKWQEEFEYGMDQDKIDNDLAYGQVTGTIPSTGDSTLSKEQFENNKTQYDKETARDMAMELLSLGEMPDNSLLSAAGISPEYANAYITAVNRLPVGGDVPGDDPLLDKEPSPAPAPKPAEPTGEPTGEPRITNKHGDSWVAIAGGDRVTYKELEGMVERDEVIEVFDEKNNTVTYRIGPNYKK